ncbi:Mut7-C RNAse domain-containing protein [Desulfobaculum sp.]
MVHPVAVFRFHGDIRQFLKPGNTRRALSGLSSLREARSRGEITVPAARSAAIKDEIEAIGVPHTEVGRILMNSAPCGFDTPLAPGAVYDVHPLAPPVDVTTPHPLRPTPFPGVRFIVDVNVRQLGTLLRLLGCDAAFDNAWEDDEIAHRAKKERRIVLTRDRALLHRSAVVWGRLIRSAVPDDQLLEVLHLFGLTGPFSPFTRCLRCNTPLERVPKADIIHRLQPLTKKHHTTFHICPTCQRIYWPGTHRDAMLERLARLGIRVDGGDG